MSDLNASTDLQLALPALRAELPLNDITEIGSLRLRKVAPPVDSGEMKRLFIGTTDKISQ